MALLSPAIPTQKTVKLGIAIIAVASLTALLYYGRDFFVTLIVSAVFAFILDPVVELVMKLRLRARCRHLHCHRSYRDPGLFAVPSGVDAITVHSR